MSGQGGAFAGEVRARVAEIIGTDDFADGDDLFDHGLDSLGLIRLAGTWREQGAEITFADLAAEPTVRAWTELLETAPAPAPATTRTPAEDEPFELATMQHAYWIGRQDEQPLGGVAAHFYTEFDGHGVEPARLTAAVAAVVERHPMLRARFLDDGRQRIVPPGGPVPVTVHDLRDLPAAAVRERLDAIRDDATHRRMDVASGRVLDVALSLLPDGATRLHVDLDMIVADALSLRVLLDDLVAAYDGRPLPPLEYGFARYLAERASRDTAARQRDRAWWHGRLGDLPAPPELPTVIDASRPTPAGSEYARSTRLHHRLDPERARRLTERARAAGVTPAAALAAAFAEALGGWSGAPRFLLNLPLFDRAPLHPDIDQVIGDFSGSVLLAADVEGDLPFTERAERIQRELHQAIGHGAYSGVEVLRDLARAAGGTPVLAPVVYTSAIGLGPLFTRAVQECFGRPTWIISQGPQVWLDAQVTELDGGLLLNWDAREKVFAPGVLESAFAAYRDLVDALVDDPDTWRRPFTTPGRPEIVGASSPLPQARPLHGRFFSHARRAPDATALVASDGTTLSYGELAARALRVAGAVAARLPVGGTVAVDLPRGFDQVAAVLGVLAAGCAYLPVGREQPPARRARVIGVGGAGLVLAQDAHAPGEGDDAPPVLAVADALAAPPLAAPRDTDPDAVAYVLFTSGSTGVPKGVEVAHRAAAHTIDVLAEIVGFGASDRTLALAEPDFDMSVYDLFAPLSAGGAAVLVEGDARRDATRWADTAARGGVTILNCVPALLDLLLSAAEADMAPMPPLRAVLLGGDRVGVDLPGRLGALAPGCRFLALGGMTEAAIHSTLQEVERVDPAWRSIPWGRPLPGVACRVVDARERDRPDHAVGELWVGGAGLALGYRGDPDTTADRFVVRDGRRWYRTGDLVRRLPDGTLDFLGRADHQVKVRGVRVELGEVEAALTAHPDIAGAVALVLPDPAPRLVAAVTAAPDATGDPAAAAAGHAGSLLPASMLPERIVTLPEIPLTANGKPDRAAVVRAVRARADAATTPSAAPSGPVEAAVARVWADLLGRSRVGRDDDFFALGGDSLLATRVVAALREEGYADAGVGRLFASPVLRDFAAALAPQVEGRRAARVEPDPDHAHDPFPPTEVQRAYLTGRSPELPLGGVGTHHYTEFDGAEVDLDRLEHAWNVLVRRHGMLRAVFDDDGRQRVLPEVPHVRIPVTEAGPGDPDHALAALREEMAHRVFEPGRWPLFDLRAVRYVRDGVERTRLGVGLDYLVLDALSIMTLYTELGRLYTDPDTVLDPIDVTFRDYVTQVHDDPAAVERARDYWRERAVQLPPPPALPLATDPATVATPRFTRRSARLDPGQWRALTDLARGAGITPSTLLLACYAEVLGAWSGQTALSLTLTLFNRHDTHPHISRVLGDFTSLSLTSYRRDPGEKLLDATRSLQRRIGRDLDHREASAPWVLRDLAQRTGVAHTGVPVVFTSSLGLGGDVSMDLPPAFPERVWGLSQSPQVHLDNQVLEIAGGLQVYWDAVEELFRPDVLDAMFAAYLETLRHLARTGRIAAPPDLLPARQREERRQANATRGPAPRGLLHDAVFARADQRATRPAVITDDGELTHGELVERALRMAAGLRRAGVEPGQAVAIGLPKGADQVCAVLGALAAGAVYVPVGPDQPARRRERIHRAAGVVLAIAEEATSPGTVTPARLLSEPPLEAPVRRDPDDTAYVIFTSGSSGEPKGVEVTHAAALNTVTDINERYGVGPDDRVFALSALDFDLSVYDLFGLLGAGGALVLPGEEERRDAARWRDLAERHRVTVWNTVPALLDMLLLAAQDGPVPPDLRLALVSGDWVGTDLAPRLREATGGRVRLVALGGATEAAIWSNAFDGGHAPEGWPSVPYGRPLRNQRYRVVDPHGRDCPEWVPGELWIGGAGVALGYRGDPDRTADRFVTDEGVRWYRTGDLGRYRPGALLEFLGRADRQVKIGGHRLEPGEVEAALEDHPAVRRAAVVASGPREARRLVAFVVARGDDVAPGDLAAHLADRVPAHAVPALIHVLAELPLTANGKVDLAALTERAGAAGPLPPTAAAPLGDDVEREIARVWSELVGVPVADREANFFTLGGTSLLAIRMITTVRAVLGVEVPTRSFLAAPTLAALAARVRGAGGDRGETGVI